MNKKGLFFAFSVFGVATLGIVGMAGYAASQPQFENYIKASAYDLNSFEFNQRNDGGFTLGEGTGYGEGGYKFVVTDTNDDAKDWKLGPFLRHCPVSKSTTYFFEFVYKVEGALGEGETGGVLGSAVRLEVGTTGTRVGDGYVNNFSTEKQYSNLIYTTLDSEDDVEVVLKLGDIEGVGVNNRSFTVTVYEFVIKLDNSTGDIYKRVNFESGAAFANRWKAGHVDKAYCTKSNVEQLIRDYCELVPSERASIDYFQMKDKVLSRVEPGTAYQVNTWTTLHDTEAHGKVETLDEPTELYRGGMFVNTGLSFEAGKEYTVTFDVSRICEEGNAFFKVFLQKDQWDGAEKIELAEPSHVEETLSFTIDSTLWISVEMGEGKNEVIISNFSLKEVETGKYLTGVLDTNEKDRIVDSINYFAQYHNIIIA